jgi:hypothetical protein
LAFALPTQLRDVSERPEGTISVCWGEPFFNVNYALCLWLRLFYERNSIALLLSSSPPTYIVSSLCISPGRWKIYAAWVTIMRDENFCSSWKLRERINLEIFMTFPLRLWKLWGTFKGNVTRFLSVFIFKFLRWNTLNFLKVLVSHCLFYFHFSSFP